MIHFFAEDYSAPASLDGFLSAAFYVAGSVAAIAVAYRAIFPKKNAPEEMPQPLIVQQHEAYVRKAEFDAHVAEVKSDMKQLAIDAIAGRKNLHGHIDQIKSELADMPEKVINLLLKTKGLGL